MDAIYENNTLTAAEFLALRGSAGWGGATYEQVEAALRGSPLTIKAVVNSNAIGMGRLVGDGAIVWYVQDVIVLPQYQGRGVGREIMRRLLCYVDLYSLPGTNVMICLMSAKGREGFYHKLGFASRPNDMEGDGMIMHRRIPPADGGRN